MKSLLVTLIMLTILPLLLTGCAPGGGKYTEQSQAGFFSGVWHGWIAPVTLIISIFSDDIRIYEKHNTGWWYDFGYYIAIIGGFGGLSLTRRKLKKKEFKVP